MFATHRSTRARAAFTALCLTFAAGAASAAAPTGGAAYVSGGVGESGREELNAVQQRYSLKLVFAYTSGKFLAEVDVEITDAGGDTLVSTRTEGPWLLVDLPAGSYRVTATVAGDTQRQQVSVPGSGLKTVNMLWTPPAP